MKLIMLMLETSQNLLFQLDSPNLRISSRELRFSRE